MLRNSRAGRARRALGSAARLGKRLAMVHGTALMTSLLLLCFVAPSGQASSHGTKPSQLPSGGSPQPQSSLGSNLPRSDAAVAQPFFEGLKDALVDRRRIDELVALFEYSGVVSVLDDGQLRFEGQGAVKRFMLKLFDDHTVTDVHMTQEGVIKVSITDSMGSTRVLSMDAFSRGAVIAGKKLIHELTVHDVTQEVPSSCNTRTSLFGAVAHAIDGCESEGPKWETYDGRVHQRIWQHQDIFALGNLFLKDTMGLTTGRLIAMVDSKVWEIHGAKMRAWAASVSLELDAIVTVADEDHKNIATFTFLLDELKRADPLRRSEPVLAVGGGVLTDLAGFACATWRRGIPWCRLPTTLLGMVDASVGIKVAMNYHRKNGVGHFYSPSHTFIDQSFLSSLPLVEIRSGVGEIMKAALIHDSRLYDLMDAHGERLIEERFLNSPEAAEVIKLSVDAMLECIGPDLWEEALLRPMDFGHSFSRTLEANEQFYLRHGEAVAIDCIISSLIAQEKGLLPIEQADSLLALYARLGLPCSIKGITASTYKVARDEITVHRDGLLRAPLPAGIGKCAFVDSMSDSIIESAFARLEAFMAKHPQTSWDPSKSFAASRAEK